MGYDDDGAVDSSENRHAKIYRKLGEKIDGMQLRAPWKKEMYELIRELYSAEEADVVARMPYCFSNLERITQATGYNKSNTFCIVSYSKS